MPINRAILLGNVGQDPEIRSTNGGDKVASFSLATSESWKDKTTGERKETTEWHRIVVFNQALIPVIQDYVKKGGKVGIEGKIKTRKWQGNDGVDHYTTEIVIGRFDGALTLEGSPVARQAESSYGSTRSRDAAPAPRSTASASMANTIDDDIPF